jgi:UDP-N-acetylmuramate--alanine ligase
MKIHFVGVGGIGISALARHFLLKGEQVTGSDLSINETVKDLQEMGAIINKGHSINNLDKDTDYLIYSPAIPNNNPELKKARELKIKTASYPQALGELTKEYKTIAVSGTHGKSTTTGMISLILIEAGFDPTVLVGTKLKEFNNSNYRKGNSEYLLIEADEWQGSLLNYNPDIAVLTNLESEHLDFYKDLGEIIDTFQKYVKNIKKEGTLIFNQEDNNLLKLDLPKKRVSFSKKDKEAKKIKDNLRVPGDHNLENALAAYRVGKLLNISEKTILKGLSNYRGSWRRFEEKEIIINNKKQKIVIDYAHHPTELKATLQALKEKYPEKKIVVLFQPHQYQRSYYLKDKFVDVLNNSPVEKFYLLDIYSVEGREREEIKRKINSKKIIKEVKNEKVFYLPGSLDEIGEELFNDLQGDEIIAIIGAGDIYLLEKVLKGN